MSKAVFEVESDGPSVIIWEAGVGHRIYYRDYQSASVAYDWLVRKSNEIHRNKVDPSINVYVTEAYGEPMTSFELVRRFLQVVKKFGNQVEEASLNRDQLEYW